MQAKSSLYNIDPDEAKDATQPTTISSVKWLSSVVHGNYRRKAKLKYCGS